MLDLGFSYQIVLLCGGDLGFSSQRAYDLEVWLPISTTLYRQPECYQSIWTIPASVPIPGPLAIPMGNLSAKQTCFVDFESLRGPLQPYTYREVQISWSPRASWWRWILGPWRWEPSCASFLIYCKRTAADNHVRKHSGAVQRPDQSRLRMHLAD